MQVEADFYLQLEGRKQKTKVGEIIAYIVDRATTDAEDKSKKPKPIWLSELLADDEDDSKVSTLMRLLYTKKGAVRAAFRAQEGELAGDKICHLDCLKLKKQYREGKGVGKTAVDSFHDMLPQLESGFAFSGTVVLSPATPDSVEDDYEDESLFEQEGKLIKFYGKRGYEVWVRGKEEKEGSISIMGRTI